jgi:hypothetical protein
MCKQGTAGSRFKRLRLVIEIEVGCWTRPGSDVIGRSVALLHLDFIAGIRAYLNQLDAVHQVRMKSWDLFLASYSPSGDAPRNLGHWYETMSFSPDGKFIVHPSFGPEVPNLLETVNVSRWSLLWWQIRCVEGGRHVRFSSRSAKSKFQTIALGRFR